MKITDTIDGKVAIEERQIAWHDFGLVWLGAITLLLLIAFEAKITILQPLRILLGLAYVLFVPGYCLTAALFPRVDDLNRVERLGLSIGLSVASIPILVLVLDWLPWGLHLWPILLGEFGTIGIFMAVALWRRSRLPLNMIYLPRIMWRSSWSSLSPSDRCIYNLLMGSALLILGLAAGIFLMPVTDKFTTEFYILGSDGFVADYPYEVSLHDEVKVNVGVMNRENSERNYYFEVWVTDSLHPDGRERVIRSDSFSLRPGEKYEQSVSWHMPSMGDDQKVELLLFPQGARAPSRQLRMWINVRE